MNYFLKLLIKLSNCLNVATFFSPAMQKHWPHFILVSIQCEALSIPKFFLLKSRLGFRNLNFCIGLGVFESHLWQIFWLQVNDLVNDFCIRIRIAGAPGTQLTRSKALAPKCFPTFVEVKSTWNTFVLQQVYNLDWKVTDVEGLCMKWSSPKHITY